MPNIAVYAHKGGQGVTTIAVALATLHARTGHRTLLLDTNNDCAPVLGIEPTRTAGLGEYCASLTVLLPDIVNPVTDHLDLITAGQAPLNYDCSTNGLMNGLDGLCDTVVVDLKAPAHPALVWIDQRVLVTRPCYLALRQAVNKRQPDHIVVLNEPGRALTTTDIVAALGLRVTATIPVEPATARLLIEHGHQANRDSTGRP